MNKVLFLFLLLDVLPAAAQTDTVKLKEVLIYGSPVSRYSAGTKVIQFRQDGETGLLNQALSQETAAYFKNYGNNQLSTIAFRGTSASHTAVLWNGININSPTLGQTDFALLPVFLLEDIAVQYGTASSQYGTDALGGSVILSQSSPRFEKLKFQIQQVNGSFGRNFTGIKSVSGSARVEFRTKVFFSSLTNNFPYYSPEIGYRKRQNDAAVSNQGIDQQIHFFLSRSQQISFEGMYTNNFRNIQPTVTLDSPGGTLRDENGRTAITYRNELRKATLFATAGYAVSKETYNISDITKTGQLNFIFNMEVLPGRRNSLRYGVQAARYEARTGNFPMTISEERYDGFVSFRQQMGEKWNLSANLRQSSYAARYAPFAPSLGLDYTILRPLESQLKFKTQWSRGYRIPTLNDRYWIPGGNPALKPEDARHGEAGLAWSSSASHRTIKAEVTYFQTLTNEWIIWLPSNNSIWSPSNLQKVSSNGLEISSGYSYAGKRISYQTGLNYAYTRSTNLKGLNDFDTSSEGKQLPYVPFHVANAFLKAKIRSWSAQIRSTYTSRRYTTLDNTASQSLVPYTLLDMNIARSETLKDVVCTVRLELNNLFNTYYETMQSHAMPGRNYTIHLILNLNSHTKQQP